MIDEKALRRATFDPQSVPVDFAGTTLYLPRPRIELRRDRTRGRTTWSPELSFGPDYDALLTGIDEAKTLVEFVDALAVVAEDLLLRNYDLTTAQIDKLLCWTRMDAGEEGLPEPWEDLLRIARGGVPKSNGRG